MKFMSFSAVGDTDIRLGVETAEGIIDLTAVGEKNQIDLAPGATLAGLIATGTALDELRRAVDALGPDAIRENRIPADRVRPLPPVPNPEKVIGIGLNYHDHAEEVGMGKPTEPFLFAMWANTVIGPDQPIRLPRISDKIDYEAELAVIIGKHARNVPAEGAVDVIAGYTIVNDVSARDLQMKDNQWIRGKSFDTALPMGPVLVTTDALGDGGSLDIGLRLNGKTMQSSNTRNLIFDVPHLVSYISETLTLKPGDVIATGTPGGVGFKRQPPVYLKSGDIVEIEVEGIGILRNSVEAE